MTTFRVYVRQWVEEIATLEIEADSKLAAIAEAMEMEGDIDDWSDGSDSKDFEVMDAEEVVS